MEVKKILTRYKATSFAYGEQAHSAVIMFELGGRRIKFILPMPMLPTNQASPASRRAHAQLCRSRWRCLVLAIKAKLECVESGICTFEQEFMAHIILPS